MRRVNAKTILTACEMSFNGKTDAEIADTFENVRLKRVPLAKERRFGKSLNRNSSQRTKKSLLEAHRATLEDSTP